MADPLPKYARTNPRDPIAFAQCDRCGFWRNRTDLVWQAQWAGTHLFNTGNLVCQDRCYDTPNEQLRTIILPPDPMPVDNARVPNFAYEEWTPMVLQFAGPPAYSQDPQFPWGSGNEMIMADQTGEIACILQYSNYGPPQQADEPNIPSAYVNEKKNKYYSPEDEDGFYTPESGA